MTGKDLTLNLGYSHPVVIPVPEDIQVQVCCLNINFPFSFLPGLALETCRKLGIVVLQGSRTHSKL